jgi:quercetin dioxygenase-like cupin family protein
VSVRRTTTALDGDTSRIVARDVVEFQEVDLSHEGAAEGLRIARLDDGTDPERHWVYVHFPPHTVLPPHATPTIDYVTVLEGELDLVVPGEEPVRLRAGDSVVQRGALHSWQTTDSHAVTSVVVFKVG